MSRREDERKPLFACVDCISYHPGGLSYHPDGTAGICTVADHVALPPWVIRPRGGCVVQWNDTCELFEADSPEVKP